MAFVARKAAMRAQYMASILAAYRQMEQVGDAELMDLLHCEADDYYRLALCHVPNLQAGTFAERVRHIAGFANVSVTALASIIKRVKIAQNLAETLPDAPQNTLLKAARDRDQEPGGHEATDGEA